MFSSKKITTPEMCALCQTAPINETVEKHSAPSRLQSKSGRKSGSSSSGVYANHRVSEVFTVCVTECQ